MRVPFAAGAVALFYIAGSGAQAWPGSFGSPPSERTAVIPVQLNCNRTRCIDPRTGAYTQSGCDQRGCHPISGIIGYTNPQVGPTQDYGARRPYGTGQDYEPVYRTGRAYDYDQRPRRRRYYDDDDDN